MSSSNDGALHTLYLLKPWQLRWLNDTRQLLGGNLISELEMGGYVTLAGLANHWMAGNKEKARAFLAGDEDEFFRD